MLNKTVLVSRKGWDMGVKYEELKNRILREIEKTKNKEGLRSAVRLGCLIVYAIQLRNGARVSEAVEALNKFLNKEFESRDGKKLCLVRVRKKKKPEARIIVYPEFIPFYLLDKIKKYRVEITTEKAKAYCKEYLGVNTHTLRYARITYLLEQGINPSIVAKITKHSKLDFILKYTQEKLAEKVNLELV